WRGAVLAGFLAASAGTGEAMAWGGYPQLIGLGILPVYVLALESVVSTRRPWAPVVAAVLSTLALGTNDLVGPFTVLVGTLYVGVRFGVSWARRTGGHVRRLLLTEALSVLFALPLAPIYLALVPGIASVERAKLPGGALAVNPLHIVSYVTQDFANFWIIALGLALISPMLLVVKGLRNMSSRFPQLVLLISLIL